MKMIKYYAGVGSRKTPPDVLRKMTACAKWLQALSVCLRSGGAAGADSAFEAGSNDLKEIFLAGQATGEALVMASRVHPAWHRCSEYAKNLHARNCFQVFGRGLDDPVGFVVCWTPCGSERTSECGIATGGTGTAIRLADNAGIPVFNMRNGPVRERIEKLLATK